MATKQRAFKAKETKSVGAGMKIYVVRHIREVPKDYVCPHCGKASKSFFGGDVYVTSCLGTCRAYPNFGKG